MRHLPALARVSLVQHLARPDVAAAAPGRVVPAAVAARRVRRRGEPRVGKGEQPRGADVVQPDGLQEGGKRGERGGGQQRRGRVECEEGVEHGAGLAAGGLVPEDGLDEERVAARLQAFLDQAVVVCCRLAWLAWCALGRRARIGWGIGFRSGSGGGRGGGGVTRGLRTCRHHIYSI